MCTTCKSFGEVELVTNRAGRSVEQARQISFHMFTNGTICAYGYSSIPQVHIPVHVGGIAIYPDDLMHGNYNEVTTIPKEIAVEVADISDAHITAEKIIIKAMRRTTNDLRLLGEFQMESKSQIENSAHRSRAQRNRF